MLSTPWGKQGYFYQMWELGGPEWERVRVQATDCPRISGEFLEEVREVLGAEIFRQEHMCEFIGSGMNAFDRDLVEATLDDSLDPL